MTKLLEIDAYLTGEHPDVDAFEEELFANPDDADVALLDKVARYGAPMVEHGTWDCSTTLANIEAMRAKGIKVQVEERWPGENRVDIDPTADFVCTRLHIGATEAARVDVEIEIVKFGVTKTIRDVAVDHAAGTINAFCERPLAQLAYGAGPTTVRIRERTGARRVIADYAFNAHLG